MIQSHDLYTILQEENYTFFSGVPCSYFSSFLNHILADATMHYFAAANEGLAVSTVAGGVLAGKKGAVILQNSGLGNTLNPLTSLCIPFGIPLLLFVSGRAYQIDDEPQHQTMGKSMHAIFKACNIPVYDLPDEKEQCKALIKQAHNEAEQKRIPVAIIVKKGILGKDNETIPPLQTMQHTPAKPTLNNSTTPYPSRTVILQHILKIIDTKTPIISTTGTSSREIFMLGDQPRNFYMQGSMGHAASIGLGTATATQKKTIIVDGDGALLMHLGILSTIGHYQPNLVHIVLDNEAYESTGSQHTTSSTVDFATLAAHCNYSNTFACSTVDTFAPALQQALAAHGPSLIHMKIGPSETKNVPRVTAELSPQQLAARFQHFLRGEQ